VLGGIFAFVTTLLGLAASSDNSMIPAFAGCEAAWILCYAWLSRFRIVIDAECLSYRSLFAGTVSYQFTEIRHIAMESGIRDYCDRFKPLVRLVIKPRKDLDAKPVYINLKVFSRSGVSQPFSLGVLLANDLAGPAHRCSSARAQG
jgi:hypothetical protein